MKNNKEDKISILIIAIIVMMALLSSLTSCTAGNVPPPSKCKYCMEIEEFWDMERAVKIRPNDTSYHDWVCDSVNLASFKAAQPSWGKDCYDNIMVYTYYVINSLKPK